MERHAAGDEVDAPRVQSGPNPQHLLTTVLGEYLDSADAELPSAAVVAALHEFGISPGSARAALSRLVRRGLVAVRREGRTPLYHVTASAIARHRSTMHRFLAFGAVPRTWDGEWLVVSYSLPESRQAQRHALRKVLGGLGFARLYDSVWINPDPDPDPVRAALDGLLAGVPGARWSVMHSRFEGATGPGGPAAAYDLASLASAYRAFVAEHAALLAAVRAGAVGPAHALVARATLMDAWRRFSVVDPDLPDELLPTPWPRAEARATFLEVHSALGPLAQERLVELMSPSWPQAAAWVTHYVAAEDPSAPPLGGRR
ncbi:PaaX family transcriptional regulator C-terminal domain-containing protein [Cellulomonas sp. S1-8]|uniref:PaaX family transcriptional regulator n=1 Tax=Cellulomonas sp. S1-8 TaxID=2904790 RepID=UPI00224407F4|nr:PaaX family transcriptional regulator C-terminal domain-containing protein [Cellulomonas sp. S1-8]UZN01618.1 PaaX family transcriptional regulator [Cellulomonas sp. S1-8]